MLCDRLSGGWVADVAAGGLSDPRHGLSLWPCLWIKPVDRWILNEPQHTPHMPTSFCGFWLLTPGLIMARASLWPDTKWVSRAVV